MSADQKVSEFVGVLDGDMANYLKEYLERTTDDKKRLPKGFYYFGIVACACYFESILERYTASRWKPDRFANEDIAKRAMEKLGEDLAKTTGLESWSKWFDILFDVKLKQLLAPQWEGLVVLFQTRNALAHGRGTKIKIGLDRGGKCVGVSIDGSPYQKSIEYLIRKSVVAIPSGKAPSAGTILTPKVVSHFRTIVQAASVELLNNSALKGMKYYASESDPKFDSTDEGDWRDFTDLDAVLILGNENDP
jgi:hypothetical protein